MKPALPAAAARLPWLPASPFRYGRGRPSHFRSADTWPGIFYASEAIETAVTEAAYWRLLGFARSPGFRRPRTLTPMSAFSVMVDMPGLLDLTCGALGADRSRWTHPTDYAPTQAFAAGERGEGITAIRAPSARHATGINLAILDPTALVPPPRPHSSWALLATDAGLIATREMEQRGAAV